MLRKLLALTALLIMVSAVAAQVMLNEICYDTQGTDDPNVLFTEIYGPAGTELDGWTLVGINGNGGAVYRTVTLEGTIPPSGYFVIANRATVPNVTQSLDVDTGGVDWQNAGSPSSGPDCDGIDLRNPQNQLVDHLCYGQCRNQGGCTGEGGTNAEDYNPPSSGPTKSLARMPDHSDTDNNAVDWAVNATMTPGAPNTGAPCPARPSTLSEIRQNSGNGVPQLFNRFVVTRGIVNCAVFVSDSINPAFYFQDGDAGVNVYRGNIPRTLMEGDCVTVSARVSIYRGLTELKADSLADSLGNCVWRVEVGPRVAVPSPEVLTCATPMEGYEGMLARINNVSVVSGDWPSNQRRWANLTITDGTGTLIMRVDDRTNIYTVPEPQGTFSVTGVITQYDTLAPFDCCYQITPRYAADVTALAADDRFSVELPAEFRLAGAFPNPFNSTTTIRFEVGTARVLTLRVFDLLGREVDSAVLTNLTPGSHEHTWSPSGAAGLYLVKLEGATGSQMAKVLFLK